MTLIGTTLENEQTFCNICNMPSNFTFLNLGKKQIKVPCHCKCVTQKIKDEEEQNKQIEKRERLERLFKQSRLGERFKKCTFDNYKVLEGNEHIYKSMLEYAENFRENKNKSVLLFSHPGTGKTFLSACVLNYLINHSYSSIFVVVPDILNQIRASYNKDNQLSEEKIMYGLSEADLLILDDIGAERHKDKEDFATEKLYSIINNRYNHLKATIFTTNCDLKELKEKLGDRTFSRIFEMCEGYIFNLDKLPDFRIKNIIRR